LGSSRIQGCTVAFWAEIKFATYRPWNMSYRLGCLVVGSLTAWDAIRIHLTVSELRALNAAEFGHEFQFGTFRVFLLEDWNTVRIDFSRMPSDISIKIAPRTGPGQSKPTLTH
jgi:hypothetical protein